MMVERCEALNAGHPLDFSMNKHPKCPHCGEDFDPSENDRWDIYNDDNEHSVECPSCELEFTVSVYAQYSFSTDEQDED